jgi:hypothetical protein
LKQQNDMVLAALPRDDAAAGALRGALERRTLCQTTHEGSWGIALDPFAVGSGEIWGRWSIAHAAAGGIPATFAPDTTAVFGDAGIERPAPRQNLEWSNARRTIPSPPTLFDFDGDGVPEAIVIVETTVLGESGRTFSLRRGRVWTARGPAIALYAPARDLAVEEARDLDGDGRPDLIGRGPYTAFAPVACGSEEPYPVTGPALLFHSLPDGGFRADDPVARAFAQRDCAAAPSPVIVPEKADPDGVDLAASAGRLACARLWGVGEAALLAEIAAQCRHTASEACPRCDDRALLERWARLPAPLRLTSFPGP